MTAIYYLHILPFLIWKAILFIKLFLKGSIASKGCIFVLWVITDAYKLPLLFISAFSGIFSMRKIAIFYHFRKYRFKSHFFAKKVPSKGTFFTTNFSIAQRWYFFNATNSGYRTNPKRTNPAGPPESANKNPGRTDRGKMMV